MAFCLSPISKFNSSIATDSISWLRWLDEHAVGGAVVMELYVIMTDRVGNYRFSFTEVEQRQAKQELDG